MLLSLLFLKPEYFFWCKSTLFFLLLFLVTWALALRTQIRCDFLFQPIAACKIPLKVLYWSYLLPVSIASRHFCWSVTDKQIEEKEGNRSWTWKERRREEVLRTIISTILSHILPERCLWGPTQILWLHPTENSWAVKHSEVVSPSNLQCEILLHLSSNFSIPLTTPILLL